MTVDLLTIFQVVTPVMLFIIGWLLKLLRSETQQVREDLKEMRAELRECVRERECAAHRAQIQRQFEMLGE